MKPEEVLDNIINKVPTMRTENGKGDGVMHTHKLIEELDKKIVYERNKKPGKGVQTIDILQESRTRLAKYEELETILKLIDVSIDDHIGRLRLVLRNAEHDNEQMSFLAEVDKGE